MAIQSDGQLVNGGRTAAVVVTVGVVVGIISLFVAYEVTYAGAGPEDSESRIIITILIVSGMIFATVMIYMGAATYFSPGMSGEEATGYVEIRRKGKRI